MDFIDYVKSLPADHDIYSDHKIRYSLSGYAGNVSPSYIYDAITSEGLSLRLFQPSDEFNKHLKIAFETCSLLISKGKSLEGFLMCRTPQMACLLADQPADDLVLRLLKSRDFMKKEIWALERRLVQTCIAIGEANKWDEVNAFLEANQA
ncbi:hypothetical protein RMR21_009685 [Agrobacterium sp. rho-8.1]|nr:hypothetical protein [Agrobacterium sp. rho-8.1]